MMRILGLIAVILLGCQQNPYAGKPDVAPPGSGDPNLPPKQPVTKPTDPQLIVPRIMEFREMQNSKFSVRAGVPTGVPQVFFRNLPPGMPQPTDPAAPVLDWTPGSQDANDPHDSSIKAKFYEIEVQVVSSEDATVSRTERAMIVVKDNPQPVNIIYSPTLAVTEGYPVAHKIEFQDVDFPTGIHDVSLTGFQPGVVVDWPDRTVPRFTLRWPTNYLTVQSASAKNFSGHLELLTPSGLRIPFDVTWTVNNATVKPIIVGQDHVAQSGDISFILMAEDVNGENEPQWSVIGKPAMGVVTVNHQSVPKSSDGLPRSAGFITWQRIPATEIGKTFQFQVKACSGGGTTCAVKNVEVQVLQGSPP
jgi:hypothetical protein